VKEVVAKMRRKAMLTVTVAVLVTTLIAFAAYRLGLRHGVNISSAPISSSPVSSGPISSMPTERAAGPPGLSSGGCVDFQEAGKHTGEQACISGRVLRVFTSKTGNTFFDFCADYRNCSFTSVVFASDRPKFGDLGSLQGRNIELRGQVRVYRNQPEIVVNDPGQIHEAP
jgi:hypothetical protein